MARDHARILLSIWSDDDFRDLTQPAQGLYLLLLSHPDRSFAGTVDWRPNRLRQIARDWSREDLERSARELAENLYIIVDEETEEVFIRTFVRHDGLMKQPNMAVAMVKAFRSIASRGIRGVFVHELLRLREDEPDLKGWVAAEEIIGGRSIDPSEYPTGYPSPDPSSNPSGKGEPNPSDHPSPTPYSILHTPNSLLQAPAAGAGAGPDERPTGRAVPADGWALIRDAIPSTHPQTVRTDLAIRAGTLLTAGTPEHDIRAALALWLDKPHAGPGLLPSLVSEVVKSRDRPTNPRATNGRPRGHDPSDWLDPPSATYVDATPTTLELE